MPRTVVAQESDVDLIRNVLSEYDLPATGLVIGRDTVGYANTTFIVEIGDKKFALRQSNPQKSFEHLQLEIEVLTFLKETGFALSPKLIANKNGYFFTEHDGRFYMLQDYIPGEIVASWNRGLENFNGERLRNLFRTSASFTRAVRDFRSSRPYHSDSLPRIVANGLQTMSERMRAIPDHAVKEYFLEHEKELLSFGQEVSDEFASLKYEEYPKQIVHLDLHPGNFHYVGDEIVGMFDFDWIQFDCRTSDIAATIAQSCYLLEGDFAGIYVKEKVVTGLSAYRESYGPSEFETVLESRLVCCALKGYVFHQLSWATDWCKVPGKEEEALWILKLFRNACTMNDYEKLFDI